MTRKYVINGTGDFDGSSDVAEVGIVIENGFENRTDSTLTWSDSTPDRTLTLTGTYSYWSNGIKYTKTGPEAIQITDVEGFHFIYYDGATLSVTTTSPGVQPSIINDWAWISTVYWDQTNSKALLVHDERHGRIMDSATHSYLHNILGSQWDSGLGLGNINTAGDGSASSHAQFSVADGVMRDEDIRFVIADDAPQDLDPTAQIPIFYRDGSTLWRQFAATTFPCRTSDGTSATRLAWNDENAGGAGIYGLVEATDTYFVLMHYFSVTDIRHPIVAVMGQAEHMNLAAAQDAAKTEINSIADQGRASGFVEFTAIGTVIFETQTAFTNSVNARIRNVDGGGDYQDFRGVGIGSGGSGVTAVSDHGALSGLSDDDHLQYFRTDGNRVMTGNIDLAANSITTTTLNGDIKFIQNGTGVLSVVAGSYEVNVTADDDIPNKKYVDDAITAGIVSPAGADTQIQFNNAGSFGADSDFTWNATSNIMTLSNGGIITTNAASGMVVRTGDNGGGATGSLTLRTGAATGGNAGDIIALGGNGVDGGRIFLRPGNGSTNDGYIYIDPSVTGVSVEMRFYDDANDHYVGFKAPSDVATGSTGNGTSTIWTLPEGDGAIDQHLSTDGAGNLQWASFAFLGMSDTPNSYLGLPEITNVSTNPASTLTQGGGNPPGDYWTLYSANDATAYYVWYNVTDAASPNSDPLPGGVFTGNGITVPVLAADLGPAVATKTAAAIDAAATGDFTPVTPTVSSNTFTVTNSANGVATPSADVTTGFSVTLGQAGVDDHGLEVVRVNAGATGLEFVGPDVIGRTNFTELDDTPANYTGAAGQSVVVNSGETALVFEDRLPVTSLQVQTPGSTPTEISTDGAGGGFYLIATASAEVLDISVVGRKADGTAGAAWNIKVMIENTAGTAALVGTPVTTVITNTPGWTVAVGVTSNRITVTVTGAAATTIDWKANITSAVAP